MYLPKHFALQDLTLARQLIEEHPLGMLVGEDSRGETFVSHLPLVWSEGGEGAAGWMLEGHMARANPHHGWLCEQAKAQTQALVVFSGPDTYVSPRLYDGALNVPTWNYLAVHVRGRFELLDEASAKDGLLKRLIAEHEPDYAAQWKGLPADFQQKLLGAIVGFRIHVERWEGKAKMSQNRSPSERSRLRASLAEAGDQGAALLRWMDRLGN